MNGTHWLLFHGWRWRFVQPSFRQLAQWEEAKGKVTWGHFGMPDRERERIKTDKGRKIVSVVLRHAINNKVSFLFEKKKNNGISTGILTFNCLSPLDSNKIFIKISWRLTFFLGFLGNYFIEYVVLYRLVLSKKKKTKKRLQVVTCQFFRWYY